MIEFWNELMKIPEAQWIIAGTLLVFAVLIGVYVAFFFRDLAMGKSEVETGELLSDFRQMRDEGQIADDEFGRVKKLITLPGDTSNEQQGASGNELSASDDNLDESNETEKQFLTLAEAQALKSKQKESLEAVPEKDSKKDSENN